MPKWLKTILEFTVFWMQKKGYVDPQIYDKKMSERRQDVDIKENTTNRNYFDDDI